MLNCQQVISAKVVTNARSPGSRCYGLVTMSSSAEVARCITHMDRTELHGQQIYVERVSEQGRLFNKSFFFLPEILFARNCIFLIIFFLFVFFLLGQK